MSLDPALAQLLERSGPWPDELSLAAVSDEVVHPEDRADLVRLLHHARDQQPGWEFATQFRMLRSDGSVLWLDSRGRLECDDLGRRAIVAASVDITHSKALEAQLRQAQKMEAIGQLAGGVAHDFNNVLTVILGQASLLEVDPELPARLAPSIDEIILAAEQASRMTEQLLAFGRRQVLRKRDMDLNGLIREVLQLLRRLLGDAIECVFEPAPAPVMVHADRSMLTQVLLNLAVNSRDAMPDGGRFLIRTHVGPLTTLQPPGGSADDEAERVGDSTPWAQLTVDDVGTGIPAEVLPHVFDPFFTTKGVGEGSGLGLATVFGVVEQHHGVIDVATAPNQGTRFRIALPVVR